MGFVWLLVLGGLFDSLYSFFFSLSFHALRGMPAQDAFHAERGTRMASL